MPLRDYSDVMAALSMRTASAERRNAMRTFLEVVWPALGDPDPSAQRPRLSWIGFYEIAPPDAAHGTATAREMLLAAREPKPACSPIGLHGMCGRGWRERRSFTVADVRVLGSDYVACDPRDQSELVIPCFANRGSIAECWGVLDADSYARAAFDAHDVASLHRLLTMLGLTQGPAPALISL